MPKSYDIVASTGTYTGNDGQEKRRYQNVGMIIEKDGKMYVKLTSLVTVDDEGKVINFFSCFEPKGQGQGKASPQKEAPAASQGGDFNDDMPF